MNPVGRVVPAPAAGARADVGGPAAAPAAITATCVDVDVGALAGTSDDLAAASLALARWFAGGATLWCVSPRWPAHARHLALEFVHPVVVGARALPAVAVDDPEPLAAVRLQARPGDVVAAVAPADDHVVAALLRRLDAWGLAGLWIGAGDRPTPGAAHHVLWVDGADPALAGRSGVLVLLYHLLWELTHVVFEHPGLLAPGSGGPSGAGAAGGAPAGTCVACADEGRPAEVAAVVDATSARVLVDGRPALVDTSLVSPVAAGDLLLVHAAAAITVLDRAPAARGVPWAAGVPRP